MSGFNVEPDMTRANVVDETLTASLAGRRPAEGDELASELAWMIEQINNVYPLPVVSEHVEDTHLVRMMEAARALPMPVTAPIPLVQASPFDRLRAGLSRKVAAATLTFTAVFGGAAYAGVLPGPVQEAVSNAAALVGLELPNPFDDDADQDSPELEGVGDDYQPPVDAVDSGPSGPRSDSGHGSDDDGLESDGDDPDQEGNDDRHAGNGAASDDDNGQDDSDEPDDWDEPDSDEPDSDEPDGGDESDSSEPDGGDESDSNEPDGGDESDSSEPDGGDSSGTEVSDTDNPDEFVGSTDSGFVVDDESASDL